MRPIADPTLLRATKRRKYRKKVETPDLHEEWAILKRLPPRGFYLDYERIEAFALIQYIILAKPSKLNDFCYKVKFDRVLYKTPHFDNQDKWRGEGDYYQRDDRDVPGMGTQIWIPAPDILLTQRQVKTAISNAKARHRHGLSYEMRRDSETIQQLSRRLRLMAKALDDLDGQELPQEVFDKIPKEKPKP